MLENFLADLKASLTVSPIVKDIEILDEFVTSVSGFLDCRVLMIDEQSSMFQNISLSLRT